MSLSRKQLTLSAVILAIFATGGSFILFQENADAKATQLPVRRLLQPLMSPVISQTITDWQEYSGRLEAIDQVDVRPQVSGKLIAVHFKDGSLVNKGDLLFTIDPRPFEAELNRAKAQLASAEAQVTYSSANLGRNQRLIKVTRLPIKSLIKRKMKLAQPMPTCKPLKPLSKLPV
jgi:multidrug efflux system membrane fusion protein